jgi:F-type H+-transporting ATPase subunit b
VKMEVKMNLNWKRIALAGLMLAVVLGAGFHLRETPVRAQAAGVRSTPEAQSPEKNQQEQDENDAYRKSPAVAGLGAKLGMNPEQSATAFEVTNFVLLAVLVGWGLAKFLPKTFRDRSLAIQKHLVDARTATEEARERLSSVEDRLARLDGEIAAMRGRADEDSAREELRIKASLEEEKKKILASAEQEIAAATMHAQKRLQQHAAELAIEQAARKLVISAETDRLLVQGFAQRLAGDESKKGQN